MKLAAKGLLLPLEPPAGGVRAAVDLGVAAEEAGFDSIWVGDHLRWHTPVLEPMTMLGALSAATSRVRLGTAVLLAGLRHPVETANALATLDHLSSGRLVAGFGSGTDAGGDFRAVGTDTSRRGARLEAAVRAVRALLRGEPLSEEGECTPSWLRHCWLR